jgi:hypothetical protein
VLAREALRVASKGCSASPRDKFTGQLRQRRARCDNAEVDKELDHAYLRLLSWYCIGAQLLTGCFSSALAQLIRMQVLGHPDSHELW